MPTRIQLRRSKGWRLPEGAVTVARPRRWGNQFVIGESYRLLDESDVVRDRAHAVELFRRWILEVAHEWREAAAVELAGRDLACWCPPGEPCHADVLLEIANPRPVEVTRG